MESVTEPAGCFAAPRLARWLVLLLSVAPQAGQARVEQIDILERAPFALGQSWGEGGAYEKIRGIAHFALDPRAPGNAAIVDLAHAAKDARGRVTFQSEFLLLRPVAARAATLLYDVNNRGNIAMLGQLQGVNPANNDPTSAADAGDGFLLRHGFALLFSAWTWDVAPASPAYRSLVLAPPVAHGPAGVSITGRVANEFTVTAATSVASYAGLRGLTYEPMIPDDPAAVLTARARPDDPRRALAREVWRLLPPADPGGPGRIALDGGFQTGQIYEVSYTARDPFVTGTGLAGIRDLLAWFRDTPFEGMEPPDQLLIFGISQSARAIGRMLQDGLDVDESGRLAFQGAFLQVPGGGGAAGFNSRFAQPTRHPSLLEYHDAPSDAFPFSTAPSRDPVSGVTASRLDRAADAAGRLPKLMIANTSTEFWNRDASLIATLADATQDLAPADNTRIYGFMGAQHYVGRLHGRAPFTQCVSTIDHYLPMRALILALERWTAQGVPPPPSAYPQLGDGTLVSAEIYRALFPTEIGATPPEQPLAEPRLDFGADFTRFGIMTEVPPLHGPAFATRVPAPDADGNDKGGVRMIELMVPIGTYTGWNQRSAAIGFPWATARFDGSFIPFARTAEERAALHDPRPSLAERYASRDDFIARLRQAASAQRAAGFLLDEDVPRAIAENLGRYDRLLAHDPADRGCGYLFAD